MSIVEFIGHFASKKLLATAMAYSLIVLDGMGTLALDPLVVQASAACLVTFIATQGAVDFKSK